MLEGNGAHETVLRKGEPMVSPEAKTCLLSGKKLRSAKLTIARGEEIWSFTLDADEFIFRGLKLPDTEAMDAVTKFQERMAFLDTFRDIFFLLFDRYIDERKTPGTWKGIQKDIQSWVAERSTRV